MTELAIYSPGTMAEKVEYCKLLADSGLLPDAYRKQPANLLYAVEYGETIGVPPMAAITGIHIIKGKPSASAGLVGALVRKAGHKLRVRGDDTSARAVIIRADDPDFEYVSEWTLERAVTAKLCTLRDGKPIARDSKGEPTSWEKYPAAMLKHRAVTEVARDACEEVLFGLYYTPEELGADVDQDGIPVIEQVDVREQPRFQPAEPRIDEAEIVPEIDLEAYWASEEGRRRLTALHALMGQKYGPMDDERRHAGFSKFAGRTVTSAKQLAPDEVDRLTAALRQQPDFQPAGDPQAPASEQDQADAIEARLRERVRDAIDDADIDAVLRQAEEYVTVGQLGQVHLSEIQEAANLRRQELAQPVGAAA